MSLSLLSRFGFSFSVRSSRHSCTGAVAVVSFGLARVACAFAQFSAAHVGVSCVVRRFGSQFLVSVPVSFGGGSC